MERFYFIGVDASKKKLDFCVMFEGKVLHEEETANHQSAIYYERPTGDIERLKQLESERTLYVTDLAKYKGQVKDQKDYMPKALYECKMKRLQVLMRDLEEAIQVITDEMDEVIASCPLLSRQRELLMPIDGWNAWWQPT